MKKPQAAGRTAKAKTVAPAPAVALKVFIGYADLPAFRHASASVGEAVRSRRRRVELQPLLWRFDQLTSAHWRARTIEAALEADIVVLASSAPAAHTSSIEGWINRYLAAAHGRRTTLVVISGPADAWTISIELPAQPARSSASVVAAESSPEELVA